MNVLPGIKLIIVDGLAENGKEFRLSLNWEVIWTPLYLLHATGQERCFLSINSSSITSKHAHEVPSSFRFMIAYWLQLDNFSCFLGPQPKSGKRTYHIISQHSEPAFNSKKIFQRTPVRSLCLFITLFTANDI
jgi:hypothetical protein